MAVVMFTDIEGSTSAWALHRAAMRVALARHDELLRDAIGLCNGTVFKHTGDGCCATFLSVSDAAAAAAKVQRDLELERWEDLEPLRVRIAMHVGEADQRGDDWFGPALNRCARLMAIGHGGQVLVSGAAQAQLVESLPAGLSLVDLGTHRLRDLSQAEHVWQLDAAGVEHAYPPLRSLEAYRGNLPSELSPFIGREQEQEELCRMLGATERLVTLVGPGGMGKTRLALQVAASTVERFTDGVWFIELASLGAGQALEHVAIATLGLQPRAGLTPVEVLTSGVVGWRCLVVVDNCEHLIVDAANLVGVLLRACPRLTVLATSRAPLRVPGERVHQVRPLSIDDDASALFADRATRARPGFALHGGVRADVAELCRQLDGMPLAIELAAARMRSMSPGELRDRLSQRFRLLRADHGERLTRHATLEALIQWSDDLLGVTQREALRALAVFAGGFDLVAAHHVVAGLGSDELDTLDVLDALVGQSLVQAVEHSGRTRYSILETIRQFSLARLGDGDRARLQRAHAEYFVALAEKADAGLAGREQVAWLRRLELEHDNVRSSLRWSLSADGDQRLGLRLAASLSWFWRYRSHLAEGRRWLEDALALASPACGVEDCAAEDAQTRVKGEIGCGLLAYAQSDFVEARQRFGSALDGARDAQPGNAGWALHGLGRVALETGDLELASSHLQASLDLFALTGDRRGLAYSHIYLGSVYVRLGEQAQANELFELAGRQTRLEGDSWGLAALLTFSAAPAVASGDLAEGARRYGEALGLYTELGTVWMTAQALLGLANTAGLAQRWERSVRLYAAAETLGRAMGRGEHEVQQGTNRAYAVLGHDRGDLHEQDLADAREALGDGLFEDVWRQGRELSFDEALHDAIAVAAELVASRRGAANDRAPLLDLTPRERQVLALLGEGRANKEMAQGLRLSVRTIENHLAHIYLKLNVQGRVEAALLAQSMGVAGPA